MSRGKDYILVKYNEYGYDIYLITDDGKLKLNRQNKITMHRVLRKFPKREVGDNRFIYDDYKLIMLYFGKEKLKPRASKVNRKRSRNIIAGILLTTTLITGIKEFSHNVDATMDSGSSVSEEINVEELNHFDDYFVRDSLSGALIESSKSTYIDDNYVNDLEDNNELVDVVEVKEENNYDSVLFNTELESINSFCYQYDSPNDKGALNNSYAYIDIYNKYEKIYGVDANLLAAIGAQESFGIHYSESINGGYATGLMGIEYIWDGGTIYVFNFETNSYETIVVDYSRIGEVEYNIKIGAAIFQSYFYDTLNNDGSIGEEDKLAFSIQKYNMGPGNMANVLGMGSDWIGNRDIINAGDNRYFEHVLSRLDNDMILKMRLVDGSYFKTKINNISIDKNFIRT